MSDNVSKYDWMVGLFGKGLWDAPQDQAVGRADDASLDASCEAGAR